MQVMSSIFDLTANILCEPSHPQHTWQTFKMDIPTRLLIFYPFQQGSHPLCSVKQADLENKTLFLVRSNQQ